MAQIFWKKSNYKLMTGKWKIGILLEAGYQAASSIENLKQYIELEDHIYFQSQIVSYPYSQPLSAEEINCFCDGLKMVCKYIRLTSGISENAFLIIALRYIYFSECNIQNEAFTAAAIQWASEMFDFSMPNINVYFNPEKSVNLSSRKFFSLHFDFA